MKTRSLAIAAAATVALAASDAATEPRAGEPDTALPDLSGRWVGVGAVQRTDESNPINVRCEINGIGKADATSFGFEGACRAMLIMKREIGAEIQRVGDAFTGVYVGSRAGPAALNGTMTEPDTLTLNMTFAEEVNGDDQAVMTITRPNDQEFVIVTRDRMVSGVEIKTADITFSRTD